MHDRHSMDVDSALKCYLNEWDILLLVFCLHEDDQCFSLYQMAKCCSPLQGTSNPFWLASFPHLTKVKAKEVQMKGVTIRIWVTLSSRSPYVLPFQGVKTIAYIQRDLSKPNAHKSRSSFLQEKISTVNESQRWVTYWYYVKGKNIPKVAWNIYVHVRSKNMVDECITTFSTLENSRNFVTTNDYYLMEELKVTRLYGIHGLCARWEISAKFPGCYLGFEEGIAFIREPLLRDSLLPPLVHLQWN